MKSTIMLLGLSVFGVLWAELGQVPLPELSNMTATGLLGWYAWHTATRTVPALMADFRDELAEKRKEVRADREMFRRELSEERLQRHADQLAVVQALHDLTTSVNTSAECRTRSAE